MYEWIVPAALACNIFRTQNPSLGSHHRHVGKFILTILLEYHSASGAKAPMGTH